MLTSALDSLGFNDSWAYLAVFLAASLLMMWRLEAMLDHGLEGTALGTLLMPYCSGLGNLIFVGIMIARHGAAREVLTNCLVNNVTNLTLVLGVPALLWGLAVVPEKAAAGGGRKKGGAKAARAPKGGDVTQRINRLSLLLTLAAGLFFTGAVWVLSRDGKLDRTDGLILIGLFLFWQTFQVYDVMKHNIRQKVSFGAMFYVDLIVVLVSAYLLYESIDWIVAWLSKQKGGWLDASHLGWLTGWLMVLPNALLALYWGRQRRADIVYTSQVGDGHICVPLCLGLFALVKPLPVSGIGETGLIVLLGAAVVHGLLLLLAGGLPRWAGAGFIAAYGWFVWQGLIS